MAEQRQQRIVVGVNGSVASCAALRWAAEEARLRRAKLHVVRAWNPVRHAAPYAAIDATPTGEEPRAAASDGLLASMRAAFGGAAPDDVTAELAEGMPERVLVARSAAADLLVLGVTAPAWRAGPSDGPVIRACLTGARCPVVVIGPAGGMPGVPVPGQAALADATT